MDKQTFLVFMFGGQLLLIALDLRERFWGRNKRYDSSVFWSRSMLFLLFTLVVYATLHYGGLALVPNGQDLLNSLQRDVNPLVTTSEQAVSMSLATKVVLGVVAFYFVGLCDYLVHRYVSHSRPMWFTHENHHLPTDVSAFMPGVAVRPFAVVVYLPSTAATVYAVHLVFGLSGFAFADVMPLLYTIALVQIAILGISHSAFLRHRWWVHKLLKPFGITTPQEHWLHHTSDLECNYGNSATLWDRVFGTYVDPEKIVAGEHRAGLDYDQDFLGAITAGKLKLSDRLRDYFKLQKFCYLNRDEEGVRPGIANPERTPSLR